MARKVHDCDKYIMAPAVNLDRRQGSTRVQKDRAPTKKPRQEVLYGAFFMSYESGVPGPVRTANLPLRRGMLYPIELLGQMTAIRPRALRRTACMLTAEPGFVMSSVGFLSVGQALPERSRFRPANTGTWPDRAKCIPPKCQHCKLQPFTLLKQTQLIDFNGFIFWHDTCNSSPANPIQPRH
jgi:hypothetical protein